MQMIGDGRGLLVTNAVAGGSSYSPSFIIFSFVAFAVYVAASATTSDTIRPVDLSAAVLRNFCPYLACCTYSSLSPSSIGWRCHRNDHHRDWGCRRHRSPQPRRPRRRPFFPLGRSIPLLLLILLLFLLLVLVLVLLLPFDGSVFSPRRCPRRGRTRRKGLGALPSGRRRRPSSTGQQGRGSSSYQRLHLQIPPPGVDCIRYFHIRCLCHCNLNRGCGSPSHGFRNERKEKT